VFEFLKKIIVITEIEHNIVVQKTICERHAFNCGILFKHTLEIPVTIFHKTQSIFKCLKLASSL